MGQAKLRLQGQHTCHAASQALPVSRDCGARYCSRVGVTQQSLGSRNINAPTVERAMVCVNGCASHFFFLLRAQAYGARRYSMVGVTLQRALLICLVSLGLLMPVWLSMESILLAMGACGPRWGLGTQGCEGYQNEAVSATLMHI